MSPDVVTAPVTTTVTSPKCCVAVCLQAYFGQGSGPIVMDQVDCWGLEASLAECAFDPTHDCTHAEDAGVLCFGTLGRYRGGAGRP